jgi:hypothetical protein
MSSGACRLRRPVLLLVGRARVYKRENPRGGDSSLQVETADTGVNPVTSHGLG